MQYANLDIGVCSAVYDEYGHQHAGPPWDLYHRGAAKPATRRHRCTAHRQPAPIISLFRVATDQSVALTASACPTGVFV